VSKKGQKITVAALGSKPGKSAADSNEQLLGSVAKADMAAFALLYDRLGKRIYGIVYRILREPQASEDAMQDAFLKIWHGAAKFDPARGEAVGWMCAIARNAALDMIRKRRDTVDIDAVDLSRFAVSPIDPPDAMLAEGLARLPTEQANALIAMHNFGFSHSELADHLGVPLGTAKSWVRRGTQGLRDWMTLR
jgi:RNA polymerase sigma-70 factor, ECF subfamily